MSRKKGNENFTAAELAEADALTSTPRVPQPDEFAGMGGSYIVDPVTGRRTRVAYTRIGPVRIDPVTGKRVPVQEQE